MSKVLVLGRRSSSTRVLICELLKAGEDVVWIEERRDDKSSLLLKRVKKFGLLTVLSQIAFMAYKLYLSKRAKARLDEILYEYLDEKGLEPLDVTNNVNSVQSIKQISNLPIDVIILSGTRILNNSFISNIKVPIVNIHAGITPRYRGVHGGYWALVNDDCSNFGSTIHYVDRGVDTGEVITYTYPKPTVKDNFITYPILQQKEAAKAIGALLADIKKNKRFKVSLIEGSNIWTHPTIVQYFRSGVK